jgi:hypothetical protein
MCEVAVRVRHSGLGAILVAALAGSAGCGASPDAGEDPQNDFRDDEAGPDGGSLVLDDCDASGMYAVRMANYARFIVDSVTSNWYYLEISQEGDELRVVDSLDCGYGSAGGGMRAYTSATGDATRAEHNSQAGRVGVMRKSGEVCDFKLDRFWSVHGLAEELYLPDGHFATYDLAHLQELLPLPTDPEHEDVQDWDEDGFPGTSTYIGSSEARYSVSRDWNEWFSCNGTAADSAICTEEDVEKYTLHVGSSFDEFTVRADFEGEDAPLGATSELYAGMSMPLRIADNRVTFKRIGRTRDDEVARTFWAQSTASARCAMLRELLPIEEE